MKSTVSYLICKFLSYEHDQNLKAEKPVLHSLLHTYCHLIDSLYYILSYSLHGYPLIIS